MIEGNTGLNKMFGPKKNKVENLGYSIRGFMLFGRFTYLYWDKWIREVVKEWACGKNGEISNKKPLARLTRWREDDISKCLTTTLRVRVGDRTGSQVLCRCYNFGLVSVPELHFSKFVLFCFLLCVLVLPSLSLLFAYVSFQM